MRKSFVFLLCAVLLFSGCAKYEEHTIVSFDEESRIVIENSETDRISELLIKEKKYTFEGKDLVVLDVTNITGSSLSVTINVSFFTKNGKTVETQTQTFDQFSAGYSNNFLFAPNMAFDKFEYRVETSEAGGPFYADKLEYKYNGLREMPYYIPEQIAKDDYTMYPAVLASFSYKYTGDAPVQADIKWLLVNESGQIVYIAEKSRIIDVGQGFDRYFDTVVFYTLESELVWEDEWKGDIQAIPILQRIVVNPQIYH